MKKIIAATSAVFILSGCWSTSADYYTKQVPEEAKKEKEQEQEEADNLEKKKEEAEELERKRKADEDEKRKEEFEASWSDYTNYDYYAYEVRTKKVSKRNGGLENIYTGYAISQDEAEMHDIKQTPMTGRSDTSFSFWQYDIDFTPKSHEIILVKFPKDNHDEFVDVRIMYIPLGEFYWNNVK